MEVACSACATRREPSIARTTPRPPCSVCGATGITLTIEAATEVNIAGTVNVSLGAVPERDWSRRWEVLTRERERLHAPRAGELSAGAVQSALQELQSFFIQAYHLKDALKADRSAHGISATAIERTITSDPDLALAADLANLDKHFNLTRPPRSGLVPRVISAHGVRPGSGKDGWTLEVQISHGPTWRDGLEIADSVVRAWETHLTRWGLI